MAFNPSSPCQYRLFNRRSSYPQRILILQVGLLLQVQARCV